MPIVSVSSIRRICMWAINYIRSQISSLNQVSHLLLQLEAILSVVPIVFVELTILVLVPSEGISLDLPRPLYKVFILDLNKHLGNKGVKGRQHKVRSREVGYEDVVH